MPLFGRRHREPVPRSVAGIPGLADQAAAQGWQAVSGRPFGHDLVDGIHDITRAMYGDSRLGASEPRAVGDTTFSDALRARIDGRTVIVANAHTFIERLARSDTPLAAFADVRTPEEAMARFGSLPESQRMQLLAMFMRVDGSD